MEEYDLVEFDFENLEFENFDLDLLNPVVQSKKMNFFFVPNKTVRASPEYEQFNINTIRLLKEFFKEYNPCNIVKNGIPKLRCPDCDTRIREHMLHCYCKKLTIITCYKCHKRYPKSCMRYRKVSDYHLCLKCGLYRMKHKKN